MAHMLIWLHLWCTRWLPCPSTSTTRNTPDWNQMAPTVIYLHLLQCTRRFWYVHLLPPPGTYLSTRWFMPDLFPNGTSQIATIRLARPFIIDLLRHNLIATRWLPYPSNRTWNVLKNMPEFHANGSESPFQCHPFGTCDSRGEWQSVPFWTMPALQAQLPSFL